MKNILKLSLVLVVATLTSCTKDYVCSCTYTSPGNPTTTTKITVKEATKKQAEAKCNSGDRTITVAGFGLTETQTCTLE